jgi:hypothetical protein
MLKTSETVARDVLRDKFSDLDLCSKFDNSVRGQAEESHRALGVAHHPGAPAVCRNMTGRSSRRESTSAEFASPRQVRRT